ncbi:MAG: hypothetical protein V2I48_17510 [Xanthomonadales bacterium]|jgi:hypothetical protein|nr:hypothetical protein [Xanthomonadales bacterium]
MNKLEKKDYQVTVNIDTQGTVSCDPDTLKIEKSWGTVNIKWKVKSEQDWEITGISAPDGEPLDAYEFKSSKKHGHSGWKIQDRNRKIKEFEYVVHVQRVKTGECVAHDPIIKNGGRK